MRGKHNCYDNCALRAEGGCRGRVYTARVRCFRAAVCGNLVVNGDEADVYFTNKSESDVWLLLRVTDENGEVLAETGLVRAGEYVKTIRFEKVPTEGQKVLYKVMAYESETYLSRGYFTVRTEAHTGK